MARRLYRRLASEKQWLLARPFVMDVDVAETANPNPTFVLDVTLTGGCKARFVLDADRFPFVPPLKVTVNGHAYRTLLASSLLRQVYGRCQCCESLLCTKPWTCVSAVVDLADEVQQAREKSQRALEVLYARMVARVNIVDDNNQFFDQVLRGFFI